MRRRGTNIYAHCLDFQYNNFGDVFSIVKKLAWLVNFSISHCWEKKNSQCSTPLVGLRLYRHVPNSPRDKNKMMHHPYLLEKVVFWPPKLCFLPLAQEKKPFSSIFNFMILQMVRNECVKFGRHTDRQVDYKILQLKIPNNAQTLHNPPCFLQELY